MADVVVPGGHQLPATAKAGFHAVAPDLRGYGDSDKPRDGYDKRTMARDRLQVMHKALDAGEVRPNWENIDFRDLGTAYGSRSAMEPGQAIELKDGQEFEGRVYGIDTLTDLWGSAKEVKASRVRNASEMIAISSRRGEGSTERSSLAGVLASVRVAPPGGTAPRLSTNPLAIGIPSWVPMLAGSIAALVLDLWSAGLPVGFDGVILVGTVLIVLASAVLVCGALPSSRAELGRAGRAFRGSLGRASPQ